MRRSELMIGGCVKARGRYYSIAGLSDNALLEDVHSLQKGVFPYTELNPVELDTMMFKKLGFEAVTELDGELLYFRYSFDRLSLEVEEIKDLDGNAAFYAYFCDKDGLIVAFQTCRYVHELQNLVKNMHILIDWSKIFVEK